MLGGALTASAQSTSAPGAPQAAPAEKPAASEASQPGPAAPPAIDQALRDRVNKFYQAHVDGKFRQAEQYIAEDTKDAYYARPKPHYRSFEILDVAYSDQFTKAKVTTQCVLVVRHPMFGTMDFATKVHSLWRIENGLWVWYLDPNVREAPLLGPRPIDLGIKESPGGSGGSSIADRIRQGQAHLGEVANAVRLDKSELWLSSPNSEAEVKVANTLAGITDVKLETITAGPWLEAKLEKERLAAHEITRVVFRATSAAEPKSSVLFNLVVQATGQRLPIRVYFGQGPK